MPNTNGPSVKCCWWLSLSRAGIDLPMSIFWAGRTFKMTFSKKLYCDGESRDMGIRKAQVQILAVEPQSSGNLGKLLNHNFSVCERENNTLILPDTVENSWPERNAKIINGQHSWVRKKVPQINRKIKRKILTNLKFLVLQIFKTDKDDLKHIWCSWSREFKNMGQKEWILKDAMK